MKMYQLKRFGLVAGFGAFLVLTPALAQQRLVDASRQQTPPRGKGPFPGSNKAGHSAWFPIRLEVEVRDGRLRQDRSVLIDFILTNIGSSPISLPSSVDSNVSYHKAAILTLWVTSDVIEPAYLNGQQIYLTPTSADLYMESNSPDTLVTLAPNESMRVHASSPTRFRAGAQTITGHAELLKMIERVLPSGETEGYTERLGTADSEPIEKLLLLSDDPHAF